MNFMNNVQVRVCGLFPTTVEVSAARLWYHVVFPFGIEVKVNPRAKYHGNEVRFDAHGIAMVAVRTIEALPVNRLRPALIWSMDQSRESQLWVFDRLGLSTSGRMHHAVAEEARAMLANSKKLTTPQL